MNKQPEPQFSFPGFDPPHRQNSRDQKPRYKNSGDNFFFALQPDNTAGDDTLRLAQRLCNEHELRGQPFMPARQHISLLPLAQSYTAQSNTGIPELVDFANKITSLVLAPPFEVILDRVLSFSGKSQTEYRRPIVLVGSGNGVVGIENLFRAQIEAVSTIGIPTKMRKFSPHMTLLYDLKNIPEQTVEPIQWTAQEFVLIQSHVGQNRPYTVLGRWPLRG